MKVRLPTQTALAWLKDPASYIDDYNRAQDVAARDRPLLLEPTRRQMATALEILRRMKTQRGVLLADDVGLGKTTVGALVAGVFAGAGFSVRILAPNATMAGRWLEELKSHQQPIAARVDDFKVSDRVRSLRGGGIAISTHARSVKTGLLGCGLLIVDEAHRAKNEASKFAQKLRERAGEIDHVLVLTATPFSIAPSELSRMLAFVGSGDAVDTAIAGAADALETLWNGRFSDPGFADTLANSCSTAIVNIRPYVIRHGVSALPQSEQRRFGAVETPPLQSTTATEQQTEMLIRADRLLGLGKKTGNWTMVRTNDPRFHVGWSQLKEELDDIGATVPGSSTADLLQRRHIASVRKLLSTEGDHPKMIATGDEVLRIVREGERVVLFCDHHATARELALYLGRRLRDEHPVERVGPAPWGWTYASACLLTANNTLERRALVGFVKWLGSEGINAQVLSWLERAPKNADDFREGLTTFTPRRAPTGQLARSIAKEVEALWGRIRRSSSSRAVFANGSVLVGASLATHRIVAATTAPTSATTVEKAMFHAGSPDTVLALFNSPFGPDVLVATDAFSEGFDLHKYCRHIIHYELDPSPMRTIQRNGRLRRVDCWAARTGKPLIVSYPVFRGTRDERLVETMKGRLTQFDLLLGGVGNDIERELGDPESQRRQTELLAAVRKKLLRQSRALMVATSRSPGTSS
ncbi:MAG: SNF2-related protein [Deltaproteobacteria bacterium]|nr:SNF2-related protein [Deltaproteobacteria bacterium]